MKIPYNSSGQPIIMGIKKNNGAEEVEECDESKMIA